MVTLDETAKALEGIWRLAIFDPAFIAQVAPLLGFLLALSGLAVFVGFFLYEARGLFRLTFNAHDALQLL